MLDPFDRDWLREDENAPDYDHYITGELTTDNLYYNRFVLGSEDTFAAVEIGVTNDFVDVMIYLNGIEVYSETDHQSNGRNYYRVLVNGMYLREGVNVVMVIIDNAEHMNNVYLYGYPSKMMYIPYCHVVDHSKIWEKQNTSAGFDYSTDYFYLTTSDDMFVTFNNDFFDAFEIDQYIIYDYHYAYTWKRWALYGLNEAQWHLLDQRNTSTFSQKFDTFRYSIQGSRFPYHRYRMNILENWGYKVTWFSELFPYVVNTRFEHNLYTYSSVNVNYNIGFSFTSLFSEDELRKENITFSITPQLPESVSLDPRTGKIRGQFGYDQKKKNFYTVTAQSEEHRDMQVLMLELSEVYCFDSYIENNRVYYNNYFLQTPFTLVFVVCGVTVSLLCFLVTLLFD